MLTENDVIKATARYLEEQGFSIDQMRSTTQTGIDLVAHKGDRRLLVEAKGATSSKPETKRYGLPFNRDQVLSHVSRAYYTASKAIARGEPGEEAALALPDTQDHRDVVEQVAPVFERIGLTVFWVREDHSIEWWISAEGKWK